MAIGGNGTRYNQAMRGHNTLVPGQSHRVLRNSSSPLRIQNDDRPLRTPLWVLA